MRTRMQNIHMHPQLAERYEIPSHNIAKLLLKGMLQSRPIRRIIMVLVDDELKQQF